MKALSKKSKESSAPRPVVITPDSAETKKHAGKPENAAKKIVNMRTKIILVALVLIVALALRIWVFNGSNNSTDKTVYPAASNPASNPNLKSKVSYTLPDGWGKSTCPSSTKIIYVVPSGTVLNCNATLSAPIKIYVDTANTTDCQQLNTATVQNIKKHVCKSLFINGHKSLSASTTYGPSPAYKTETTISDYYINTGKTVIAVEYTYTSANTFQAGFDQLAKSAVVKK